MAEMNEELAGRIVPRILSEFGFKNVFIVSASAVNYRHEQKNLPK